MGKILRGWASMSASILRNYDGQEQQSKTGKGTVTMAKYTPPEQMEVQQIQDEIDREFQLWNDIACSGCQDPTWPDGVNMNLVRNHVIHWYRLLDEKLGADTQTSLFDTPVSKTTRRPVPPKVSEQYMVAGCKHSERLSGRCVQPLVWGTKGEYQA